MPKGSTMQRSYMVQIARTSSERPLGLFPAVCMHTQELPRLPSTYLARGNGTVGRPCILIWSTRSLYDGHGSITRIPSVNPFSTPRSSS